MSTRDVEADTKKALQREYEMARAAGNDEHAANAKAALDGRFGQQAETATSDDTETATEKSGAPCPRCDFVAKNDRGLSVHMRSHAEG